LKLKVTKSLVSSFSGYLWFGMSTSGIMETEC